MRVSWLSGAPFISAKTSSQRSARALNLADICKTFRGIGKRELNVVELDCLVGQRIRLFDPAKLEQGDRIGEEDRRGHLSRQQCDDGIAQAGGRLPMSIQSICPPCSRELAAENCVAAAEKSSTLRIDAASSSACAKASSN